MKLKLKQKLHTELTALRREISLQEYLFWWLCRLVMIAFSIRECIIGDDASYFRLQMLLVTALQFVLPALHLLPRRRFTLARMSYHAQTAAGLMAVIPCVLGNCLGFYDRFWWFDCFVHLLAGIVIVPVGVMLIRAAANGRERLSPVTASAVGFGLSCFLSLGWECYEFLFDWFTGCNTQNWSGTPQGPLIDRFPTDPLRYPLYDTLSDQLAGLLGALATAIALRLWMERRACAARRLEESTVNN